MYNTKIDETKIDRLANLAVNTGLSLKPGQDLLPVLYQEAVSAYGSEQNS